ncbi:MAG: LAGLIDADG family homing endonuclease [Candidatus ainarchaeum sp.]|nr:LAGLIDADG family homing endonuclease [Candidatus ainarchaeum sp.]
MLSKDYILGFVEGEGCFNITLQRYVDYHTRKTKRSNSKKLNAFPFRVKPSFRIVCAKRDQKVLEEIREIIGVGEIYTNYRKNSTKHQNIAHYYVQTLSDLIKVRDFFKNCIFMTTKGSDFNYWCQCLDIIYLKKHQTKEGFLEICRIRGLMNTHSGKTTMWKPTEIAKVFTEEKKYILAHLDIKKQKLLHNNYC